MERKKQMAVEQKEVKKVKKKFGSPVGASYGSAREQPGISVTLEPDDGFDNI